MAVKPEQIKARLKVLFPKANLSQKRIDAIAAKLCLKPADDADDVAIDAVVNDANDFMSFEDIAKDDDRVRTLEANQKAPTTPAEIEAARIEAERLKNLGNPPAPDDAPAWAKALIDSNKKLADDLQVMKSGKVLETKKQTAQAVFETSDVFKNASKEVKDFMLKNIDVESETPIEDQVKGLEDTFGKMVQGSADTNSYAGPAGSGAVNTKPNDLEVNEIVDNFKI